MVNYSQSYFSCPINFSFYIIAVNFYIYIIVVFSAYRILVSVQFSENNFYFYIYLVQIYFSL